MFFYRAKSPPIFKGFINKYLIGAANKAQQSLDIKQSKSSQQTHNHNCLSTGHPNFILRLVLRYSACKILTLQTVPDM